MGQAERTQEKEIDGVTYSVTPLSSSLGLKALDRFKNIAAPVMASFLDSGIDSGLQGGGVDAKLLSAFADVLRLLPGLLKADDVEFFQKAFGPTTKISEGGQDFALVYGKQDQHFSGRYVALFDWLTFCMEVNFTGFFGELMRRGKDVASKAKGTGMSTSTSPATTGSGAAF